MQLPGVSQNVISSNVYPPNINSSKSSTNSLLFLAAPFGELTIGESSGHSICNMGHLELPANICISYTLKKTLKPGTTITNEICSGLVRATRPIYYVHFVDLTYLLIWDIVERI